MKYGKLALSTLFNINIAFDTADHDILLHCLDATYGIQNNAHLWIALYLSDGTQNVYIIDFTSSNVPLTYSIPQSSVQGPLLFITYTGALEHIINLHGYTSDCYADDSRLLFFCNPAETESMAYQVVNCVDDVSKWMLSSNILKVNQTNTEFLWAVTCR